LTLSRLKPGDASFTQPTCRVGVATDAVEEGCPEAFAVLVAERLPVPACPAVRLGRLRRRSGLGQALGRGDRKQRLGGVQDVAGGVLVAVQHQPAAGAGVGPPAAQRFAPPPAPGRACQQATVHYTTVLRRVRRRHRSLPPLCQRSGRQSAASPAQPSNSPQAAAPLRVASRRFLLTLVAICTSSEATGS